MTTHAPHLRDLIAQRLSRRAVLGAMAGAPLLSLADAAGARAALAGPAPAFASVPPTTADAVTVPAGYTVRTLIAWGDALHEGMAPFDPDVLTRADQERRFGQNNDMLALFPADYAFPWPKNQRRHLLCANHEYVEPALMFPSVASPAAFTRAQIEAMWAAMGLSVVQVAHDADGAWRVVRDGGGGLNRRVTPFTPVVFSGPANKHPWIAQAAAAFNAAEPGAPDGAVACGTLANCAGGMTPWGTYLSSEENFNFYFWNADPAALTERLAQPAYARDAAVFGYRPDLQSPPTGPAPYNLAANPTGPALYGWVVEIDPYDPAWTPRKRTALGRRKGECATTALTRDGRVAVYSGDDQIDQFVYKFVSRRRFRPADRRANRDLLDDGVLHAARLEPDGTGVWIPLTLRAANAAARETGGVAPFADEGDLMVRAREAARLLGATPMDRPEDVEAVLDDRWTGLGPVLIACTKNAVPGPARPGSPRRPDPAAPGAPVANVTGHILRLDEDDGDCGARRFRWDVFVMAGDPDAAAGAAVATTLDGRATLAGDRFACPDNVCFDSAFNVWITTDGSDAVFRDCNDNVVVAPLTAAGARPTKRFLVGPVGSEICGPLLSPDERAFFCAIQHPGDADGAGVGIGELRWAQGRKPPSTFPDGGWPRSAVVYVTKDDGGKVGT
ncbi:MAG: DUF839 domain-containing protein [Hyphomonadaceae bacterium]|nr:DUF839 domain-containing protein [Hyphomonadaceae bacterium]